MKTLAILALPLFVVTPALAQTTYVYERPTIAESQPLNPLGRGFYQATGETPLRAVEHQTAVINAQRAARIERPVRVLPTTRYERRAARPRHRVIIEEIR